MRINKYTTLYIVNKTSGEMSTMAGRNFENTVVGSRTNGTEFFDDFDIYTDEEEAEEESKRLKGIVQIQKLLLQSEAVFIDHIHEIVKKNKGLTPQA